MRSAGQLIVDRLLHAAEIARFHSQVLCVPTPSDCNIWTEAIGADGYGRFYLTRHGVGFRVRPHRYALAIAGGSVAAGVLGLHERDNPVCVKFAAEANFTARSVGLPGRQHGADGADASRRWAPCGATVRQSRCLTRTLGGAARCGATWLGRRRGAGGAAW